MRDPILHRLGVRDGYLPFDPTSVRRKSIQSRLDAMEICKFNRTHPIERNLAFIQRGSNLLRREDSGIDWFPIQKMTSHTS